jgi:carbon-monoxide dehydrogenase iron sulfur subunit
MPCLSPLRARPSDRQVEMDARVLIVDEAKCTGCLLCSIACSIRYTASIDLERAHIKIWRTDEQHFVPLTCHHCETPSCALACPTKACHEDKACSRVLIDEAKCIGCRTCVVACPFGHAHYDRVARVSAKCDYCDGEPECARVCEPRAITFVFADEDSDAKRRDVPLVRSEQRLRRPQPRPLDPDQARR